VKAALIVAERHFLIGTGELTVSSSTFGPAQPTDSDPEGECCSHG